MGSFLSFAQRTLDFWKFYRTICFDKIWVLKIRVFNPQKPNPSSLKLWKAPTFMELATKQAEGYTRELIAFLLRPVFRTPCGLKPWGCVLLNSWTNFAACASQSNSVPLVALFLIKMWVSSHSNFKFSLIFFEFCQEKFSMKPWTVKTKLKAIGTF